MRMCILTLQWLDNLHKIKIHNGQLNVLQFVLEAKKVQSCLNFKAKHLFYEESSLKMLELFQ